MWPVLPQIILFFFFNDTATTEIYTLSLHDALPIFSRPAITRVTESSTWRATGRSWTRKRSAMPPRRSIASRSSTTRSEEHTSELQSRQYLVCRLLLEKKKNTLCLLMTPHPLHLLIQ